LILKVIDTNNNGVPDELESYLEKLQLQTTNQVKDLIMVVMLQLI
jgi:hypothetical protein